MIISTRNFRPRNLLMRNLLLSASACLASLLVFVVTSEPGFRGEILTYLLPSPLVLALALLLLLGAAWRGLRWQPRPLLYGTCVAGSIVGAVLVFTVAVMADPTGGSPVPLAQRLAAVLSHPLGILLFLGGLVVTVAPCLVGYGLVEVVFRSRSQARHGK